MALFYYYIMLVVSLVVPIIYAFIFHKHFDVNITIMCILIPVVCLSSVMLASSKSIEEALVGLKLTYIGGCYILLAAMFLIFNICGVDIKPWIRAVLVAISSIVFCSSLTIGSTNWFYKTTPT